MVDGVSIAAITIAVFDELIKIGNRTAVLIREVRAFKKRSQELYDQLEHEGDRNKQLKRLLFTSTTVYGGQCLFEQFESEVQVRIDILLGRSKETLEEGYRLLTKRYCPPAALLPITQNNVVSTTGVSEEAKEDEEQQQQRKGGHFPSLSSLRWALGDKQRVETVLDSFMAQNDRLHQNIKLWCLAADLGVNLAHLRRLEQDEDSRNLGFHLDATLRLTQAEQHDDVDLELRAHPSEGTVENVPNSRFTSSFSIIKVDGETLLRETFLYIPSRDATIGGSRGGQLASESLDARTRARINALAQLLCSPKESGFLIPHCLGWTYSPQRTCVSFLFTPGDMHHHPGATDAMVTPLSLLDLIKDPRAKPDLGDLFSLAARLATCIAQLHMVQWLHESFRSENIIIASQGPRETDLDWAAIRPSVLGFEFTRREEDFSNGIADSCPKRDVYRHPDRQGLPERRFEKVYDLYALGVVLLEIGLWQPAFHLQSGGFATARDGEVIKAQLLKHARRRLGKVGKKYQEIVIKCLTGDFGVSEDTRGDLRLQQAFRSQVIDVLERAARNV